MNKNMNYLRTNWSFDQLVKEQALRDADEQAASRKGMRQALVVKRLNKRILKPTVGITKY